MIFIAENINLICYRQLPSIVKPLVIYEFLKNDHPYNYSISSCSFVSKFDKIKLKSEIGLT